MAERGGVLCLVILNFMLLARNACGECPPKPLSEVDKENTMIHNRYVQKVRLCQRKAKKDKKRKTPTQKIQELREKYDEKIKECGEGDLDDQCDTFDVRFFRDRQIGEGGFGRVFLGTDVSNKSPVAIKYAQSVTSTGAVGRGCASNEVLIQDALSKKCPNIPGLISWRSARNGDKVMSAMDLVHCKDLAAYFGDSRPGTPPSETGGVVSHFQGPTKKGRTVMILSAMRQAYRALSCMHSHKVAHTDIKPENIMLDSCSGPDFTEKDSLCSCYGSMGEDGDPPPVPGQSAIQAKVVDFGEHACLLGGEDMCSDVDEDIIESFFNFCETRTPTCSNNDDYKTMYGVCSRWKCSEHAEEEHAEEDTLRRERFKKTFLDYFKKSLCPAQDRGTDAYNPKDSGEDKFMVASPHAFDAYSMAKTFDALIGDKTVAIALDLKKNDATFLEAFMDKSKEKGAGGKRPSAHDMCLLIDYLLHESTGEGWTGNDDACHGISKTPTKTEKKACIECMHKTLIKNAVIENGGYGYSSMCEEECPSAQTENTLPACKTEMRKKILIAACVQGALTGSAPGTIRLGCASDHEGNDFIGLRTDYFIGEETDELRGSAPPICQELCQQTDLHLEYEKQNPNSPKYRCCNLRAPLRSHWPGHGWSVKEHEESVLQCASPTFVASDDAETPEPISVTAYCGETLFRLESKGSSKECVADCDKDVDGPFAFSVSVMIRPDAGGTILEEAADKKCRSSEPLSAYIGIDPTGGGLHVGHLVSIRAMNWIRKTGIRPVLLIGSATASVGDPSGKREERPMLAREDIAANARGIRRDLDIALHGADGEDESDTDGHEPLIVDNIDWWGEMSTLDFLRNVGPHFRVNAMLGKESVKQRLSSGQGISFTEFSYQLLQGYDFLELWRRHNCILQIGGSDQWGNITGGCDLVQRVDKSQVHGLTVPLLTTSNGEKFGKTAGNAIWLSPERTSHYNFYQYFLRASDEDVDSFLRIFTDLGDDDVSEVIREHLDRPSARYAQRTLAEHATRHFRGNDGLESAKLATDALFGGVDALSRLKSSDLSSIFADGDENAHSLVLPRSSLEEGIPLIDIAVRAGISESKARARKLIGSGGLYLNNIRVEESRRRVSRGDLIDDRLLLLRSGRRNNCLIDFSDGANQA
eukprot:g609.t1